MMSVKPALPVFNSRELQREILFLGAEKESSCSYLHSFARHGWNIRFASDINEAKELLRNSQICTGLVHMDSKNFSKIEQFVSEFGGLKWVALTSENELKDHRVQHLISNYLYDFHTQPVDIDRLLFTLGHAHGLENLRRVLARTESSSSLPMVQHQMVGTSPEMCKIFSRTSKIASTDLPVLITGESGTGKELIATAIHDCSSRSGKPLMVVDCGALVPSLIQSELFGHEKGSFTSADRRMVGRFEAAEGGTVFLDEIGELPLELQSNLLRTLEEKVIKRIGSNEEIPVNVRVIAATNRDLKEAVRQGKFRKDLFYRLNTVHIEIPQLAKRKSDIEVLAKYFFSRLSTQLETKARGFSQKALRALSNHQWPGNVRELKNCVSSGMVLCEGNLLTPEDLGLSSIIDEACYDASTDNENLTLKDAKSAAEYRALIDALRKSENNITLAAEYLGVSRVTLYKLLKKHDLCK